MWEATGLQGDSGAFPTFRQCGQLQHCGQLQQLQPTRPRQHAGSCTQTLLKCVQCEPNYPPESRYVQTVLLLNFSSCRYCSDLQCSCNVDSMDTLHSFRWGEQQFQGHSGHSCGQWTPVGKPTLLRTFAKIIPEIHIPKPSLQTPT